MDVKLVFDRGIKALIPSLNNYIPPKLLDSPRSAVMLDSHDLKIMCCDYQIRQRILSWNMIAHNDQISLSGVANNLCSIRRKESYFDGTFVVLSFKKGTWEIHESHHVKSLLDVAQAHSETISHSHQLYLGCRYSWTC